MFCITFNYLFLYNFSYSKTSSTWVSSDCSELLVWSNCWGKDTPFEFYCGPLYNPSKHCPMSFYLLPCCFSFMPSLGCKYLEISLSILTLNTIVMSTSIRLEQEFSSCLGKWFFFLNFSQQLTHLFSAKNKISFGKSGYIEMYYQLIWSANCAAQ